MHKTFVTLAPDMGEGRDSGAIVHRFYFWTSGSYGGVALRVYSNFSSGDYLSECSVLVLN